ncbi:transketolase [Marinobacterium zhoushanense]|uniref:Transketolase n=1 Tax=Marinobacterium zhoushanense TaxID=1679163 RepID=A0ABQ1KBE7_9GAMM|nr:transketolase [Marinobacterium zhoushanense]GGB94179.1 transketolase [Marinobacterium zhoushanense]
MTTGINAGGLSPRQLANAIRALSMDAVQRANSGHPGAPMGMADIAEVLWNRHLRHNPGNPGWADRDRFVLSNGHGSMLLYSLLHLSGYALSLDELKRFRQLHSATPGHPELGYTPGVETTTGPLGQGLANAVGMALAEQTLAAQFNRPGHPIIDHHTYTFVGDGCLMEGVSHEVCSLAGTLELGKLIVFYDDNGISIDGEVEGWFSDNTPERFRAYGWQVIEAVDGHSAQAVDVAILQAKEETRRPTLICCKTTIGFGAPNKAGSHDCHGAPLGEAEIAAAREALDWPYAPFEIPADICSAWDSRERGAALEVQWQQRFESYAQAYPELAAELQRRLAGELPEGWTDQREQLLRQCQLAARTQATRKSSQQVLERLAPSMPELLGGSADLAPSNLTQWSGSLAVSSEQRAGNYIHYGVREFGMSAMMNGIALHGGFIPYGGTFLMFMEYARNAVRMAALMKIRSIFVYTHDSIGLGEDGPTHQPVEQLASLRQTPNLETWRPCDETETATAWCEALARKDGPTALVLSRQNLPALPRDAAQLAQIERGAYAVADCEGLPDLILLASGSEVALALTAGEQLAGQGIVVRVLSVPCIERFEQQPAEYRDALLPASVRARVAVEMARPESWHRYVGLDGEVVAMHGFGESAPAEILFEHFGFTVAAVVETAQRVLART